MNNQTFIELPDHPVVMAMRMQSIEDLKDRLIDLNEDAQTIQARAKLQKRALTADEDQQIDSLMAEFDLVEKDITRQDDMENRGTRMSMSAGRKTAPVNPQGSSCRTVEVNGVKLPLIRNSESVAQRFPQARNVPDFSIANFAKDNMGFGNPQGAVVGSPATIPLHVSSQIIDAVRAASRVVQAGSGTIMINGPTNLARIETDPTIYQHSEAATDVSDSNLVLSPVTLDPKYLIAAIPLSAEIMEDSPNLDFALQTSIAAAIAGKLDSLSIATIQADSTIPTSSEAHDPSTWGGVLAAIGEALSADQDLPNSFIGNSSDFIARAGQLTELAAGAWLGRPPALDGMKDLFTTKISSGTSIFGDFFSGFAVAMRQEIRLEVLRWNKYTSGTHVLLAHCRMDGVVLQPKRLFIQQKTV